MFQKIKTYFVEKPAKAIGITILIIATIIFIKKKMSK